MHIILNGQAEELSEESLSIAELLNVSGVESSDMVSVQLNGEFVDRARYGDTHVEDRDEVDFLYFMGGGAA